MVATAKPTFEELRHAKPSFEELRTEVAEKPKYKHPGFTPPFGGPYAVNLKEKDPITKAIEAGKAGIARVNADQGIADAYFSGQDITPFIKRKSAVDQIAPVEGGNFLSDTFYKGIGVAAPMVQSYWEASPYAAIGMVGGGIIGGIAGNLVGGPAPEELITVPAGAKVGLTAGTIFGGKAGVTAKSMEYWYRQGAGQMIHSMVKNGVDMKYAGPIAAIGGIPYAAIEFAQMSQLTPGLRQGVQDVAMKSMLRAFTTAAKKYGKTWVIENVEEVLQEGVQIAAEDIGNLFAGNDLKFDKKGFLERANRLAETSVESGQAMLLLPLPGAAVDIRSGVLQVKERNKLKTALQEKVGTSKKVAQRAVEMLEEGWTPGEVDRNLITPSTFLGDKAIDQIQARERPRSTEQIRADKQQRADVAEMDREFIEITKTPATRGVPGPETSTEQESPEIAAEIPPKAGIQALGDKELAEKVLSAEPLSADWVAAFNEMKRRKVIETKKPAKVELKTTEHEGFTELESIEAVPRGTGAGTEALQELISKAKKPIRITVARSNIRLQEWYKRHGFEEITPEDPRITGVRLEKPVAPTILKPDLTKPKTAVEKGMVEQMTEMGKTKPTPIAEVSEELIPEVPKKSVKLRSGLDPGFNEFIEADIKPTIEKAKKAGASLKEIGTAAPKLFMKVLEPAKAAEKVGREAYTATIKAIHRGTDVAQAEWEEQRNETMDMNMDQLKKWFDQFSEEENRNFLIANAGKPGSIEAEMIQREARGALPETLKQEKLIRAIREISEKNHKLLKGVVGNNIGWVQDYFYGIYKNPEMVNRFFKHWKTTKRFTKHKIHPSLADAINYGVEPRHNNYIDNLRAEYMGIARLGAMQWLRKELYRTGEGKYIDSMMEADQDWQSVKDPVFAPDLLEPSVAGLINNLISTNKITQQPVLNAFRKVGNFLRVTKFIGSIYHLRTELQQTIADSGYLGFVHKKTATRGFTPATKGQWAKIRKSPEYKRLLELGIGYRYSYEQQAQKQFKDFVDNVNKGNFIGATFRGLKIPLKIPAKFTGWLFDQYIPMVKALKVLDAQREIEQKKGRSATDGEIINIIKETQNFYGEMNERLFGRSGTVTTGMRFIYLAPGFAEGNYRTILKSLFQWGQGEGWRAGRSRSNMVNSPLITATIAGIGTLLLMGKPPKKPETLEDVRDLFKIDTGKKDPHGRKVMIDVMTYDKDYWNIYFNVLRGRPDVAVYESLRRLGGMKAPMFDMMLDFARMSTGQAIYDWKGDRVTEITDSSLEKLMKIATHEIKKTEPIPLSVFKQARKKEVSKIISFVEAVMGVRPTLTEKDKREGEILRRCWSLKGQKEEMYQSLATLDRPRAGVKWYNNKVKDVLDSKLVPKSMREEWTPKLNIDLEKYLQNKAMDASVLPTTKESQEKIERAVKVLKNFKISPNAAEQLLADYYKRPKTRTIVSPIERDRILGRAAKKRRLKERMK